MSTESSFQVRSAQLKDAVTITAYNIRMALETEEKRLDPYVVSAGVKAVIEDRHKGIYFVAVTGDRVIAQLMITLEWSDWRNGDIWWIQSVYVNPEFRKQGVFKMLTEHAEAEAIKAGAVMIRLYVDKHNEHAQKVYEGLGIAMSDYLVMEKTLPRG